MYAVSRTTQIVPCLKLSMCNIKSEEVDHRVHL